MMKKSHGCCISQTVDICSPAKAMTHMVPDRSRIAGLAAYYRKKEYFVNTITERTRLTALSSLAGCFALTGLLAGVNSKRY